MLKKTFVLSLLTVLLVSCHGVIDGIYDNDKTIVLDSTLKLGFNKSDKFTGVMYLDCQSYDDWVFVDLDNLTTQTRAVPKTLTQEWDGFSGIAYLQHTDLKTMDYVEEDFVKTDTQEKPEKWHLGIHHFDVMTSGAGVLETSYTSLLDLPKSSDSFKDETFTFDEPTINVVILDRTQMLSYYIGYQKITLNRVLSGWVKMDLSTPPPVYSSTGHVYILKFPDGKFCAMKLDDYKNSLGDKGFMIISYIYPY